jgi:hypothetical protein
MSRIKTRTMHVTAFVLELELHCMDFPTSLPLGFRKAYSESAPKR